MTSFYIVLMQILKLSFVALVAYIATKRNVIPDGTDKAVSALVVKITLPALIITTMSNRTFTTDVIATGFKVFLLTLVFLLMAYGLSILIGKALGFTGSADSIYRAHSVFGNIVFIGYPLINALYGDIGVLYAVFFVIASDILLWTLGIHLLNSHKNKSGKNIFSHIININTIAYIIGIFLVLINFRQLISNFSILENAYQVFYDTFYPLGHTTSYLSMIFIGITLASRNTINNKNS